MGYVTLRQDLHRRFISMRDVAKETGIDLTRLYNLTAQEKLLDDFTDEEKRLIYDKYYSDSKKSFEEVFARYEDSELYWNREVYSRGIRGRRR